MPETAYDQLRQKIAALRGDNTQVEAVLRILYAETGTVFSAGHLAPIAVSSDYTARSGDYVNVTASTADVTVSLPDASVYAGDSVFVRKVDATAFKVLTPVKDIAFQNSTMHLVSNGADWVIS